MDEGLKLMKGYFALPQALQQNPYHKKSLCHMKDDIFLVEVLIIYRV